jgi:hypothetical protein
MREAQDVDRVVQEAVRAFASGDERTWSNATASAFGQALPMSEEGVAVLGAFHEGAKAYLDARPKAAEPNIMNVDGVAYDFTNPQTPRQLTEPRERGPETVINLASEGGGSAGGAIFPEENADIPAGSARNAFGLSGVVGGLANRASDFLTGTEVAPEIGDNVRFFRNLEEDMLVNLSQAYGRQPAQQLMERMRTLLPNVGTIEGAQAAYRELVVMRDRFERDLRIAEGRMRVAGRMTDTQVTELERQILSLQASMAQMDEGIRRLAPPETTQGVTPDDEALINKWLNP